nr:hypothetical protein [Lithodesmioides sp. mgcode 4]
MKIKLIKKKKYKLLKYNILKSKIYVQSKNIQILNRDIEKFEINLKQFLKLIFEYDKNNKSIYFVDFPIVNNILILKNFKQTNHKFYSKEMIFKKIKNKTIKKPHLFVTFSETFNSLTLNNFKKLNTPIILVNSFSFLNFSGQQHKVDNLNLLNNIKLKNFYSYIFYSIIKPLK